MSTPSPQRLIRSLGLREGIAIQMGMIIGSGIFIVPATVAGHLGSLGPILLVWALGGVMVLFGALTLAELCSVLPETGGPYVYELCCGWAEPEFDNNRPIAATNIARIASPQVSNSHLLPNYSNTVSWLKAYANFPLSACPRDVSKWRGPKTAIAIPRSNRGVAVRQL